MLNRKTLSGAFRAMALGTFATLLLTTAQAGEVAADDFMKSLTNDVLQIVKDDRDIQNGDARKAARLIESRILPNFDFPRMTALAVGKDWRQASPEQRRALTDSFQKLLVKTYSNALTEYRNQSIEYSPSKAASADGEVVVRSVIRQPGAKSVPLEYSLEKTDTGWKVFDVTIAGISLVTNYRSQFSDLVRSNGIDGLIAALNTRNRS